MVKLNVINMNGQQTIDSREVAEMISMQHKDLLEKIRNYEDILIGGKFRSLDFFIESTYVDSRNREKPCYMITKKGCEMVANKLTGEKGVLFTATYVEAFNNMEQTIPELPTDKVGMLKLIVGAIDETNEKVKDLKVEVDEKFNDMPLFNVECDEIIKSIKKKATYCLGGYHSPAYMDGSIRGKVYKDIHKQIQREFEVQSYKAINREHYEKVKEIIDDYELPVVLNETVVRLNNQQSLNV